MKDFSTKEYLKERIKRFNQYIIKEENCWIFTGAHYRKG